MQGDRSRSGRRSMRRPTRCTTRPRSGRFPKPTGVSARGIEVGHIFYFGTKYSDPMSATVQGPDGKPMHRPHGLLRHRSRRACRRRHHRGQPRRGRHHLAGLRWRPFTVGDHQPEAGRRRAATAACEELYRTPRRQGHGCAATTTATTGRARKFATADLIGIPYQVMIGPRGLAEGKVELKLRATGERELLSPADAVARITGA